MGFYEFLLKRKRKRRLRQMRNYSRRWRAAGLDTWTAQKPEREYYKKVRAKRIQELQDKRYWDERKQRLKRKQRDKQRQKEKAKLQDEIIQLLNTFISNLQPQPQPIRHYDSTVNTGREYYEGSNEGWLRAQQIQGEQQEQNYFLSELNKKINEFKKLEKERKKK